MSASESAITPNPLQSPSTPSKMRSDPQFQQVPRLELYVLTRRVGLCSEQPAEITDDDDEDAQSTVMTTDPDDISPSHFICLLFGALDNFLDYSREENSRSL